MPDLFRRLIREWSQPAIVISLVMSIVYSIVWMTKLDDRVDDQGKNIEMNTTEIRAHNKEAEVWKRKILLNEQRNR